MNPNDIQIMMPNLYQMLTSENIDDYRLASDILIKNKYWWVVTNTFFSIGKNSDNLYIRYYHKTGKYVKNF